MKTARLISCLALLAAILVLPYWFYVPLLFAAVVAFKFFWEGIFFALFIDTIYGEGLSVFPPSVSLLTLSVLLSLIILLPIRGRIRHYA